MTQLAQGPPTVDGQLQLYETPLKDSVREWYSNTRRAVYINGQCTSSERHMQSAQVVSYLQMCPVIGIFNKSSGLVSDTFQSLGDKLQFHGPVARGPENYFDKKATATGLMDRAAAMEEVLRRNPATLATYQLLLSGAVPKGAPIFAHSQGNLILSNALTALAVLHGPESIQGIVVNSYGSPTVNWPAGIRHQDHAFTGDLVALLNPKLNFRISKVGLPTSVSAFGFISHDFSLYLNDDAQFTINRFRWGGWGLTVHMDEEGLAQCLVEMGNNEPRILKIFERLDQKHNSDVDDVALLYVQKMNTPANTPLLKSMRRLIPLLVRVMEEGWTTAKEKAAIEFLKGL